MKIYSGFSDPRLKRRPRAVAIGVFDGVHRGHQKILRRMMADARRFRLSPCVVTFDPHPARVLAPGRFREDTAVLASLKHRLDLFKDAGVRECVVVRFNRSFARIPAKTFLERDLAGRLGMRSLSVGSGFRFGHRAQGDEAMLRRAAKDRTFRFHAITPLRSRGRIISSTRVRRLILQGRLREASALLGRPYAVVGTVVRGRGRGERIGFPTANLDPHHEILPPGGVYAAIGRVEGKRSRASVVHIGPRPTFSDRQAALEVHFPGFHKSLYNKEIELEFHSRLRATRRFADSAQLKRAIENDIRRALRLLFTLHDKD